MTTTFDGYTDSMIEGIMDRKEESLRARELSRQARAEEIDAARADMRRFLEHYQPAKALTHAIVRMVWRLW